MSDADTAWRVLRHDPVQHLAENLWWVKGALPNMTLERNMTVARLADGRLVIHNGVALEPAAMQALERYAAMPDLVRLIVAHEKVAKGPDARAALLQAATYL